MSATIRVPSKMRTGRSTRSRYISYLRARDLPRVHRLQSRLPCQQAARPTRSTWVWDEPRQPRRPHPPIQDHSHPLQRQLPALQLHQQYVLARTTRYGLIPTRIDTMSTVSSTIRALRSGLRNSRASKDAWKHVMRPQAALVSRTLAVMELVRAMSRAQVRA